MIRFCYLLFYSASLIFFTSCAVGPDYVRPATEKPKEFKEAHNWKQAQPKDDQVRGKWWEVFGDTELNKLEEQIEISNQNVKSSEAAYRQAKAIVSETEAAYYPAITGSMAQSRNGLASSGTGASNIGSRSVVSNSYNASMSVSWELDIWGKIRRTVEENSALAQASAADIAAARLSAQSMLAVDYMGLRIADEQKRLLDNTVKNYERALEITRNLYHTGVSARSDYLQAKTQLESVQAQSIDIGIARSQFEHAIAILIGKAPADFSIAEAQSIPAIPVIPVALPSDMLERRPDIAGAERRVVAANARIGVAKAAFFPDLTLSGSGGYQSTQLAQWFTLPNRVWSIGPGIVETIFDAGLRRAQTKAAIAAYDQTIAVYRQTVLGSFQEVEDNLAALRILEQEAIIQQGAVNDAKSVEKIFLNQYKSGIVSYLSVVTAQNTRLNNELTSLNIRKGRLIAAATLIKAIGGGWGATVAKPSVIPPVNPGK